MQNNFCILQFLIILGSGIQASLHLFQGYNQGRLLHKQIKSFVSLFENIFFTLLDSAPSYSIPYQAIKVEIFRRSIALAMDRGLRGPTSATALIANLKNQFKEIDFDRLNE